jgi:hypothetical protein
MIATRNRWYRLLVGTVMVFCISGCACPPHISSTKVLPREHFSSDNSPVVRVRFVNPKEEKDIVEFPGKNEQELYAQLDGAGSLILAPALFIFFLPEFLNPDNWHFGQDPKIKEALGQFPILLKHAIEERFLASSADESQELLEITYFADVLTVGPAADRVCFVVHAQVSLQSKGAELYREIIRIDPRAINDDIQQPDCTQSPDRIMDCANEVIPKMIQTRLPGLPWKPNG